jgi:2-polyprenyl-3-methyl-5-hydroxy-6-metoxy-1,4-benzoquinol methylase
MDFPLYISQQPKTLEGDAKTWIHIFLSNLVKGASILEVGSGTGRDAQYIEQAGYKIVRTDIHQEFVDYQKHVHGASVHMYDVKMSELPSELPQKYDAILARSVLSHFTAGDVKKILKILIGHLNAKGFIAFNITKDLGICEIKSFLNNENMILRYEAVESDIGVYLTYLKA